MFGRQVNHTLFRRRFFPILQRTVRVKETNGNIIHREVIFYLTVFHSMIDFLFIRHLVDQEEAVTAGTRHRKRIVQTTMKGKTVSSVPTVQASIPTAVIIVFGTGTMQACLLIYIGRIVSLKEEGHTRTQSLRLVDGAYIVSLSFLCCKLMEGAERSLLPAPCRIEFTFLLGIALVTVIIHLHIYGNRGLLNVFSLLINYLHGSRFIERHRQVTVVGSTLLTHQNAAHGSFAISVAKEVGNGSIDSLHFLIVPPGRKKHILVQAFERATAVNRHTDNTSRLLHLKERNFFARIDGECLLHSLRDGRLSERIVGDGGSQISPYLVHLGQQLLILL